MASVHKHRSARSPFYYASYLGEDGLWKQRSTKKARYSEAMEVALEYERAAKLARAGELTVIQCRKVLSDMLERTTGDRVEHKTVEVFFKDWLAHKETTKSERTAERYETVLDMFKEHIGPKAKLTMSAVTTRDVQTFLNKRLNAKRSTKTVSVDRKSLSSVFGYAKKQGLILLNPVAATELPDVKSQERDPFTASQIGMLLDEAETDDWKTVILLGYFTGARLGDCANMKWDAVKLVEGVVEVANSKGDEKVKMPIHPDLEKWLHRRAGSDKPEKLLCPTLAGRKSGGAHGLSQTFMKLMEDAGIDPRKVEKEDGERTFHKLSFHSLRHTFNSSLANADVSQEIRKRLTGHKSDDVNKIYTHFEHKRLKRAVRKLPGVKS